VRELAAWIESNILLQLASVPFDKQDETLVREFSFAFHQVKQAIEPHLSFQQTLYSWNQIAQALGEKSRNRLAVVSQMISSRLPRSKGLSFAQIGTEGT